VIDAPGLDPRWSRLVAARDHAGNSVTWHLLDTHAHSSTDQVRATVLCVHGNPTWSYAWRHVLRAAPADIRVIAVDQLDMGWSDRTGHRRRLADRVDDLDLLWSQLNIAGPIVLMAHDWGGPIALGFGERHADDVIAIVLGNTAVHQPEGASLPQLITLSRAFLDPVTRRSDAFIRGTTALSRLPKEIAAAYRSPYRGAERRAAIRDFVADIPNAPDHPSHAELARIAQGLDVFADTPVLILWGARDPVFRIGYLHDLERRLPRAQVERCATASHLVMEEMPDFAETAMTWIRDVVLGTAPERTTDATAIRLWQPIMDRAQSPETAITWVADGRQRSVPWNQLADRVQQLAGAFAARGIQGRVALLIPPGPDLIAVVYALWRIGATAVIADTGLGVRGMRRAIGSAGVQHVIGIPRGLALARTMAIPGQRISTRDLAGLCAQVHHVPAEPSPQCEAVVVFTSGATGPAKGVVYRQVQIERTRDAIASTYAIGEEDALVAAFAPWAVLGPALGIRSAIPDMDVTKPRTLTAAALADAVVAVDGTFTWASPAALRNVVQTADSLSGAQRTAFARLRLVLAAGAPVSIGLLDEAARIFPNARIGTPYGMTEVLPVCHVDREDIVAAGRGNGVLVGAPIDGVELAIRPESGEILVRAAHMRERYDRRVALELRGEPGWHATGDVGHLDSDGRLWVEGRLSHVITTEDAVITPVGIEQVLEACPGVSGAAAVGVGPVGTQVVVGIVILDEPGDSSIVDPATTEVLRTAVRDECGVDLVAILTRSSFPTDIRHNAKIDRTALADWANRILAGRS
jgi:acyl-coenzyme A synthetase/AMP-(fatty) acid ligase/pimeloyl-ACP methyl ester carboxylesterase